MLLTNTSSNLTVISVQEQEKTRKNKFRNKEFHILSTLLLRQSLKEYRLAKKHEEGESIKLRMQHKATYQLKHHN